MTTVRGDLEAFKAEAKAESDQTQQILADLFGSGSPNIINTLIAIKEGIDDLVAGIDAINTKLTATNTALGTLNTSVGAVDDNIVTKLEQFRLGVAEDLETINNTQLLELDILDDTIGPMTENIYSALVNMRALLASTACPCDEAGTVLPPPISVTPITVNDEHCKRVQALLDVWQNATCDIAEAVQNGASITFAMAAYLFGAGIIPGIDLGAVPAGGVTGLIGLAAVSIGQKFASMCSFFEDNRNELQNALYSADNASEAQAAYWTVVDAHVSALFNLDTRLMLNALGWNGAFNALYDPEADWDTTGYDGGICGLDSSGCFTAGSRTTTASGAISGTRRGIDTAPPGMTFLSTVNSSSGEVTDTPALFVSGNLLNWELTVLTGSVRIVSREVEPSNTAGFSSSIDFTSSNTPVILSASNHWAMVPSDGSTPFTVKMCVPD